MLQSWRRLRRLQSSASLPASDFHSVTTRRGFIASAAGSVLAVVASRADAQVTQNFAGPMQQDAYIPVKLAAKAGAAPSMSDQARDDLEHRIKCQCGCVLDVFTCRTTDFSCAVSPAMHADVMGLVAGGYGAAEILTAFQNVYGERVLMAPPPQGFNLLGYVMPFAALVGGGAVVLMLTRRWKQRALAQAAPASPVQLDATDAELDAVEAAVRNDS